MTSPRKKLDDDHYRGLLESLLYSVSKNMGGVVKPSIPKTPAKSSHCRIIYHTLMVKVINAVCTKTLSGLKETLEFHQQLIDDDLTHRHPKNLISLLMTEKYRSGNGINDLHYDFLALTVPLDGEVPKKLVDCLPTVICDCYQLYLTLDRTYVDLLKEAELTGFDEW